MKFRFYNFDCIYQGPLCSPAQLKCVENITLDTSVCVKDCEGMMITGYTYDYFYYGDLNHVIPKLLEDYGKYKIDTNFPTTNEGLLNM